MKTLRERGNGKEVIKWEGRGGGTRDGGVLSVEKRRGEPSAPLVKKRIREKEKGGKKVGKFASTGS